MNNSIIIYGGCFNPPTNIHILIAKRLVDILHSDKILFLPVGDLYNKSSLISSNHRVEMLKLVCDNDEILGVDLTEVNAPNVLNSIESLDIIQKKYIGKELIFVMGTDNLRDITSWNSWEKLLTKYRIVVVNRGSDNLDFIYTDKPELKDYSNNILQVDDIPSSNISSTILRKRLLNNEDISDLTSRKIQNYIKINKLYVGETNG